MEGSAIARFFPKRDRPYLPQSAIKLDQANPTQLIKLDSAEVLLHH
jgi:hypothetical protein